MGNKRVTQKIHSHKTTEKAFLLHILDKMTNVIRIEQLANLKMNCFSYLTALCGQDPMCPKGAACRDSGGGSVWRSIKKRSPYASFT